MVRARRATVESAVALRFSSGLRAARAQQSSEPENLLDFDMTVVSVTDDQLLVGCKDCERRIEIPLSVAIPLAIHNDTLGVLRTVTGFSIDVRI